MVQSYASGYSYILRRRYNTVTLSARNGTVRAKCKSTNFLRHGQVHARRCADTGIILTAQKHGRKNLICNFAANNNATKMNTIGRYKLLATMVRAFFESFSSAIVDCHVPEPHGKYSPQMVKKLMLEHYEHISEAFHDVILTPLAVISHSYDEVMEIVHNTNIEGMTMFELVRDVCADSQLYDAMVAEYRRNFSCLLAGRHESAANWQQSYTRCEGEEVEIDIEIGIRLVVRITMEAYAKGLHQAATGKTSIRQVSLFRLLLDVMSVLLHDEPVQFGADEQDNLGAMFLKVCRSEDNFHIMTDEMDNAYTELLNREQLTASDDTAN